MPQPNLLYNCKPEVKTKRAEDTTASGSSDSGFTMLENEENSANDLFAMETSTGVSPRVPQEVESIRGRNSTFSSSHVRSHSAPMDIRGSYSENRESSGQLVSNCSNQEHTSPIRTKTRYASQKSASHMTGGPTHSGRENTKDEKKGKPEPDILEDLLELMTLRDMPSSRMTSSHLTSSSRRLIVETASMGLGSAVGTDEADSLLEDCCRGEEDVGLTLSFGDQSLGEMEEEEGEGGGVFGSNTSSPAEESGIDRVVRSLLRISGEIETDEVFRDDFRSLAEHVTETLEDERVLVDYPSFSSTMDSLLDQYYDQTSLSTATPFKKMLFISYVNMMFIRRLRERTSQFLSTMVDYATQYIASFLPVAMIRRSSSVMSDLCHREASTSSMDSASASRSRLSSMGATSTSGAEENNPGGLNFSNRGGAGVTIGAPTDNGSSIYSSTFDLDLSSMSATSGGVTASADDRYSNDTAATPQAQANSFSGFGSSNGVFSAPNNFSNNSPRRDSLHAILSPPLPLTSNLYGATTPSQVPQQYCMNSYYASATNDIRRNSPSSNGASAHAPPSMTQTGGGDIPNRRLRRGEDECTSSFQSTAKDSASSSVLEDKCNRPQGTTASKQGSSQNVVRKKEPKKLRKTKLTESLSYDFAPVLRKESDVDSAFCTEEDCFLFPSFDSSVDLHPTENLMEAFAAQTTRRGSFNTVSPRSGFGRGPPGSQNQNQRTRSSMPATSLAQTREEYRQAAIRRRRLYGMQGRLPSFSDEMTAAFTTGIHGASFEAMEETLARSVPTDGFIPNNPHSRASRTVSAGSSSDQGVKSACVTLTFFILAAMIRYRRS